MQSRITIEQNQTFQNGGIRGYPGIKIRVNKNAFHYASLLISQILSNEILKMRIQPITQCLPEV